MTPLFGTSDETCLFVYRSSVLLSLFTFCFVYKLYIHFLVSLLTVTWANFSNFLLIRVSLPPVIEYGMQGCEVPRCLRKHVSHGCLSSSNTCMPGAISTLLAIMRVFLCIEEHTRQLHWNGMEWNGI